MSVDRKENPRRDSSSDESDHDSADSAPVESLVAGRVKRSAAGNRYFSLLQAEVDKEDEVTLLFAEEEGEEDQEFQEDEEADASDVQLDSSSDGDDQGPTVGVDSLEGEAELQKQDREERKKRRKAQELFKRPRSIKKVKHDPTTTTSISTLKPGPKKKWERTSWIPAPDQGPTRSSQRKQTVLNKEVTHLRLQESEIRRRQTIKAMEAAAKKKEASKPKAMTQEDRLAEAARVEKMNEKSLTKWEESEKKRMEEQKARLAALHNRRLEGPVITYWSGPAKWRNEKLTAVGSKKIRDEASKGAKENQNGEFKDAKELQDEESKGAKEGDTGKSSSEKQDSIQGHTSKIRQKALETEATVQLPGQVGGPEPFPTTAPASTATFSTQSQGTAGQLATTAHTPHDTAGTLPSQVYSVPADRSQEEFSGYYSGAAPAQQVQVLLERSPAASWVQGRQMQPAPAPPPPRLKTPVIEIAGRNIMMLKNIDLNSTGPQVPELQDHVLLAKKPTKSSAKQPHYNAAFKTNLGRGAGHGRQQFPCVITGQNAKYRDPKTGLAYADVAAYKQIQKVATGEARWCEELGGCYVGSTMKPARGVPARFYTQ